MVAWGGLRVALMLAALLLIVGWLLSLAIGPQFSTPLFRAFAFLAVLAWLTGLTGAAVINSMLIVRRGR